MCFSKRICLLIVLALNVFGVEAKEWTCTKYPKLPIVIQGCEGEMCGEITYNKAIGTVPIYKTPSKHARIIDRLEKCELIQEFKPYLVVNAFGRVEVLSLDKDLAAMGVKVGDLLPFVRGNDEDDLLGELIACVRNKEHPVYNIVVAEGNLPIYRLATLVKIITQNKTEEWFRLKTPRNKVGYTVQEGPTGFYMGLHTYDPNLICPEGSLPR